MTNDMTEGIITILFTEHINPMLASHGGKAKLVKVEDNKAYVEFSGGCQGCAGARMTLGRYIAGAIKQIVPEIEEVIDVTNHEEGENPFYKEEDLEKEDLKFLCDCGATVICDSKEDERWKQGSCSRCLKEQEDALDY